ncbi:WG repeat-containing protein [Brevibacillus daliensis]|uniref:WG repeat-containing protein n=1 Tax=Brevibacillus daliensis TaxID=2892995 RepID=UPI001E31A7B8|nr:WG repeat-containing protein [Brevibacillus daliensis]
MRVTKWQKAGLAIIFSIPLLYTSGVSIVTSAAEQPAVTNTKPIPEAIEKQELKLYSIQDQDKHGFIDETGKVVIPPTFEVVGEFQNGLAVAKQGEKYGFINNEGIFVIPPTYEEADSFTEEGLAAVRVGEKFGFINKQNEFIIPATFEFARSFQDGLAAFSRNGKYGFIDQTGKEVIPAEYEIVWGFQEGVTVAYKGDKAGYIDQTGKVIIPFQYMIANPFHEGVALVFENEEHGYKMIDKKGNEVFKPEGFEPGNFSEGVAEVMVEVGGDFKASYVNKNGSIMLPPTYERTLPFSEGLAAVKINGKYGFINKKGTMMIKPQFQGGGVFHRGLAYVVLHDEAEGYAFAYVNKQGDIVWKSSPMKEFPGDLE